MSLSARDILERAAPLFAERGYHGTSMSDLADACDLAKPGLYHHFRDKESLFVALLEEGLVALESELSALEERAPSLGNLGLLTEIVQLLLSPPPRAMVAMRLAGQDLTHLTPAVRDSFSSSYRRRFPQRLAALVARTGLRPDLDPVFATHALMGLASPQHRRNPSDPSLAPRLASLFAQGALTPE